MDSDINLETSYLEIFSEELDGWIVMNFFDLNNLLANLNSSFIGYNLSHVLSENQHLRIMKTSNNENILNHQNLNIGEYCEIQCEMKLLLKFINNKINIELNQGDIYYQVWKRGKIISDKIVYFEFEREIVEVESHKIRPIKFINKIKQDEVLYLKQFTYFNDNIFDEQNVNELEFLKSFLSMDKKISSIFNYNFIKNSNLLIVITNALYMNFFSELYKIKFNENLSTRQLQREIIIKKENTNIINKLLEDNNKIIYKYSKKFENSIKTKILDLNQEYFSNKKISYLINDDQSDNFEIILNKNNMRDELNFNFRDEMNKLFELNENFVEIDLELFTWIQSKKNNEKLHKIYQLANIVDYSIDKNTEFNMSIYFLGKENFNAEFKNYLDLLLNYGKKIVKFEEENQKIIKEINNIKIANQKISR